MIYQIVHGVGTVLAGIYGGPWAAAAATAVGQIVLGTVLAPDGPEVTGPRLNDLMMQSSTYGQMKPFGYGHGRLAGEMIWLKGNKLDETVVEEEIDGGGSGFGGGGGSTTTYHYSATCAFSFCDGPVIAVKKIWGDGKLFYDAGAFPPGYVIWAADPGTNTFEILESSQDVIDQFAPGTIVTVYLTADVAGEVGPNDGTYTVVSAVLGGEGLVITVAEAVPSPKNGGLIRPPGAASATQKYPDVVQVYLGTEEQLPDSAIEADRGVGQVPGYRGTCYVVFNGLPLADFANHIPNISAEVWFSDSPVIVGDIVHDLCRRAGLADADIDTTALTQTILGFIVSRRVSTRATLQVLADILQFDGVESDDILRWVPHTDTPLLTIPATALGAHAPTEDVPALLELTDTQEVELPERVELTYADVDRDYQDAMQYGARVQAPLPTQFSRQRRAIQAPMVLTKDMAKQQARRLLYEAWSARYLVAFQTSRRYAHLDPSDAVVVEDGPIAYTVRLGQSDYGGSGLVQWKAVTVDATYAIAGTGAPVLLSPPTIPEPGIAVLHVADTPMLRRDDDDPGYYVAVVGLAPSWHGAVVERSVDGGSWGPVASCPVAVRMGRAQNVLPTRLHAATWDMVSTVDIKMTRGVPENFTKADILDGRSPIGLLGEELLYWTSVTQLDAVTYRLGGPTQPLLRGRRGTEWAMSTHVISETFLIMEPGTIRRYAAPVSDLRVERFLKAVSVGTDLEDATTEHVMARGLGLQPFAPEHIRGVRVVTGGESMGGASGLPEYWALQDTAGLPWYCWFDTLGQIHIDPSAPGSGFRALTTGTPPPWHHVTDEAASPWWLRVDTLGQLTSEAVQPPGTGIVFGPEASAGITAMGADGATLYRMTSDSLGQIAVLSDATAPPAPTIGDDLAITWRHRTRLPWESLNGVAGPVSDVDIPPLYTLIIYNAGIAVRTVAHLSTPAWTYLAAWQIEDFGSVQSLVDVGIAQENNIVGAGHEGRAWV